MTVLSGKHMIMYEYALSIPDMLLIGKWKHAHFETDFLHDVTPSEASRLHCALRLCSH